MARPTWKGQISFGLVTVPVQMYTAVRSQDLTFRQINASTHARVTGFVLNKITPQSGEYGDYYRYYSRYYGRDVRKDL